MALIDFPSNPILNQVYKFETGTPNEKAYIFSAGQSGTASDGYWSGFLPTSFGPASAAEIDAASVANKYIAPDQLYLSEYDKRSENDARYVNATGDTMTGSLSGVTPSSGAHLTRKDYVDGSTSKDYNGYMRLPNGLVINWGNNTLATGEKDVYLSQSGVIYAAFATSVTDPSTDPRGAVSARVISGNQINFRGEEDNLDFYWFAVSLGS